MQTKTVKIRYYKTSGKC